MAEPLKFTFNTAFGTRSENDKLNEELPVITQEEVDAARTQGFIQGREDGLAEATAQLKSEFKVSFEQMSDKLEALLDDRVNAADKAMQNAQNFALFIAQKIAKTALSQYPTEQIKALIDDCLSHITLMPHLVIRVNQSVAQLTQDELQPIIDQKGFEGKLIILGEESIAIGDCVIEWADGGVAHNTQKITHAISTILTDYFGDDLDENLQEENDDEIENIHAPQIEDEQLELAEDNDAELQEDMLTIETNEQETAEQIAISDIEDTDVEDINVEDANIENMNVEDTDIEDANVEDNIDIENTDSEDMGIENTDVEQMNDLATGLEGQTDE